MLKYHTSWIPSGELQRMVWIRKDGKTATPRTIVRRLEELEGASEIAVQYDGLNAKYRSIPDDWKGRYIPTNKRAHKYSNEIWKK